MHSIIINEFVLYFNLRIFKVNQPNLRATILVVSIVASIMNAVYKNDFLLIVWQRKLTLTFSSSGCCCWFLDNFLPISLVMEILCSPFVVLLQVNNFMKIVYCFTLSKLMSPINISEKSYHIVKFSRLIRLDSLVLCIFLVEFRFAYYITVFRASEPANEARNM